MPSGLPRYDYFDHDADTGVIGRGGTLQEAFVHAAEATFALMCDPVTVEPREKIEFEFDEDDAELALVAWLNGLLAHANERGLALGRFELAKTDCALAWQRLGRSLAPRHGARHSGQGRHADRALGQAAGRRLGGPLRRRPLNRENGWIWTSPDCVRSIRGPGRCRAHPATRVMKRGSTAAAACSRQWTTRCWSRSPTSRGCRGSSARRWRCPTRTGATVSRSAASPRSTRSRAASSAPAASVSTSRAVSAACAPT